MNSWGITSHVGSSQLVRDKNKHVVGTGIPLLCLHFTFSALWRHRNYGLHSRTRVPVIAAGVQSDNFQGYSSSPARPVYNVIIMCRNSRTRYHNVCPIRISAPAGRYVTSPIATASSAAAVPVVFTRLLTMTLTVRCQQSQRRQVLTLTSLTPIVELTLCSRWHVLRTCLLTYCSRYYTFR